MEYTTNYRFERKSKNFLDWLVNVIESQRLREVDGVIIKPTYE